MNNFIRNFCIIAHIDHGKSTLADRFLEITGTVEQRKMKEQLLDRMELEQERGITIKLKPVRMLYTSHRPESKIENSGYILNLIDTPGHVDFTYEVSRSLTAVEGAILLIDATQGVQAQTIANLHLAQEQGLVVIPVLNKIDLPNADVAGRTEECVRLLQCAPEEVLAVSAKTGVGVSAVLDAVVTRIPQPRRMLPEGNETLQALIFDSEFDEYRGVIAYIRVFHGAIAQGDEVVLMGTAIRAEVLEVGYLTPSFSRAEKISEGEIGYVITNIKEVARCRVGDTITYAATAGERKDVALAGYRESKPMVYAGLYAASGEEYPKLRQSLDKLKLTDASLQFEPEHSKALGFGFRCGFLGLLHLDIIRERIFREFQIDLIITVPSVAYHVYEKSGEAAMGGAQSFSVIRSAQELPDPSVIERIEEPMVSVEILTPAPLIGRVMSVFDRYIGEYVDTKYLSDERALLTYVMPLSEILVDFYDSLKSATSGYASMSYELLDYQRADVVKMDIVVAEERVEALSMIVYRARAYEIGKRIVTKLKESLPRQMFEVKIQAAVGGKIVASERISAMRKDVTAKLYGGDRTRRMKLLEKQKKGKKRMMQMGRVSIPQNVYLEILKR